MLSCNQVLAELSNYLDDEVSLELSRAIAQHLARCHRCWVIYNTTSQTLEIVSDYLPSTVPVAVSERLHARLQKLYPAGAVSERLHARLQKLYPAGN